MVTHIAGLFLLDQTKVLLALPGLQVLAILLHIVYKVF
jgi:hypothetical protein